MAKILNVLDLIPPKMHLPDLQKRIARFAAEGKRITAVDRYIHIHELLNESLKGTPDEFQQLVWEGGKSEVSDRIKKFTRKYFVKGSPETCRARILDELLKGNVEVLDEIHFGTIGDAVREYTFIKDSEDKLRRIIATVERRNSWLHFMFRLETSGTITVNQQGIIEISHDRFAAAVEGVNAALIRECDNCQRIFWAGRRDKNSCSAACAHVLRNRKYRERYKQGFYQGAKLTDKEKSESRQRRGESRLKS